ncbi:MAG TPA: dihydrodipicolinate reductase C-terminal domain-containing protein [Rectinemataceae bacterium]|nr:dihydrodipicolinate reductase C-terminal domain-containing protein [Rectinemataceae bacterium]
MRIGIFGNGRLGSAVARLLASERDMELVWALDKGESPRGPVDVALDASVGQAVAGHLAWARDSHVDLVVGATGWDASALDPAEYSSIGLLVAPNFSLAVAYLKRVALSLGRLAALDPRADLSVLERHHRAKIDAPSGTAKLLAAALREGCPRYAEAVSAAPDASAPLSPETRLQLVSVRGGTEVGYHELRLEADAEALVISHEATSRDIFAQGALRALRWIHGRKGFYTFDDMADEIISPLFLAPGPGGTR